MSNEQGSINGYPSYKDSGIEWLGKIPEHWEVKKFNYIANIVEGQVDPKKVPYQNYILVAPNHIESATGRLIFQETALEQGAISGKYLFQSGDVIYSKIRPELRKVWKAEFPGICSADMYPIRLSKKIIDPTYFTFFCLSESFSGFMVATSMRVAMPKVNRDDFHEYHFIIPPLLEQKAIADYLDTKSAEIDRKIDLLTKKAKRYEELKTALINETVTRGLDKSVPMKDSGIEWIGQIPEHWQVKRLKQIIIRSLTYGANETAVDSNPKHPRFIRITDFCENEKLRDETFKSLIPEIAQKYLLKEGDILFARSGATVGKTFHFKNYQGQACHAGYLIKARPNPKKITSDFLSYYTKSSFYNTWKSQILIKATIENISAEKYGFFLFVPIPSLAEQKEIADYLDAKSTEIEQIIQTIKTQIEKLKELRKTLINDVVTGKIRVTDINTD